MKAEEELIDLPRAGFQVLTSHFFRRLSVLLILSVWFFAPYLLLQNFSLYSSIEFPFLVDFKRSVIVRNCGEFCYLSCCVGLYIMSFFLKKELFIKYCKMNALVILFLHSIYFFLPSRVGGQIRCGESDIVDSLILVEMAYHPRHIFPSAFSSFLMLTVWALWKQNNYSRYLACTLALLGFTSALLLHLVPYYSIGFSCILAIFVIIVFEKKKCFISSLVL